MSLKKNLLILGTGNTVNAEDPKADQQEFITGLLMADRIFWFCAEQCLSEPTHDTPGCCDKTQPNKFF